MLAEKFGELVSAIDAADAEPGKDARSAYATLSKMLDATLKEWQLAKTSDLAALNAVLLRDDEAKIAQ